MFFLSRRTLAAVSVIAHERCVLFQMPSRFRHQRVLVVATKWTFGLRELAITPPNYFNNSSTDILREPRHASRSGLCHGSTAAGHGFLGAERRPLPPHLNSVSLSPPVLAAFVDVQPRRFRRCPVTRASLFPLACPWRPGQVTTDC